MKKIFPRINFVFAPLLFLFVSLIFFWPLINNRGIVVGHDWMLPYTLRQMWQYNINHFFTWTHETNLFGVKNPFFVALPFILLQKLFMVFQLNGEILSKALVVSIFTGSALSMYLLLCFVGVKKTAAIIGGFVFITMPVFFNYTIMGWCFVLFSVGILLPLATITFIRSVEENSLLYSIITGLLYSISLLQSQSIIWFPIIFFSLSLALIKDKKSALAYLRSLLVVFLILITLNISWWPNLLIYKDSGVLNSDLALNSVSMGMRARLSFINILRGWGSLFNYQYEISYHSLLPLSFLVPVLALISYSIKTKLKHDIRLPMLVIIVCMFIFYSINPDSLSKIPFSNVIRDTARFTILTSYAFTLLLGILISFVLNQGKRYQSLFFVLLVLVIVNAYPFYNGQLYAQPQSEYDVRLRNYVFPNDYILTEQYFSRQSYDFKTYYPPSGVNISVKNNPQFFDGFREIKDPFRFSPQPGTIYLNNSSYGMPLGIANLLDNLLNSEIDISALKTIGLMNIKDLVFRGDIQFPAKQEKNINDLISKNKDVINIGNVKILENKYYIPHLYIPDSTIYSVGSTNDLPGILSVSKPTNLPAIILSDSVANKSADVLLNEIKPSEIVVNGIQRGLMKDGKSLVFEVSIPSGGNYQIYSSSNTNLDISKTKKIAIEETNNNGDKISLEAQIKDGYPTLITSNKYKYFGQITLEEGVQDFIIPITDKEATSESQLIKNKFLLKKELSPKQNSDQPKIQFTQINPVKYLINIENANNPFVLIFSESYHPGWQIFPANIGPNDISNKLWRSLGKFMRSVTELFIKDKPSSNKDISYYQGSVKETEANYVFIDSHTFDTWGIKPLANNNHYVANGYANYWMINPNEVGQNGQLSLMLEFIPQRNFVFGLILSTVAFSLLMVYVIFCLIKSQTRRAGGNNP